MKKTLQLMVACIFILSLLCSCNKTSTIPSSTKTAPQISSSNTSIVFQQLPPEVKDRFKADTFIQSGETFKLFEYSFTLEGATIQDNFDGLVDNYYTLPNDVLDTSGNIKPEYQIVLVKMQVENLSPEENELYTNSFSFVTVNSEDPDKWAYARYFYSDIVENPTPENRQYARVFLSKNENKSITIGYLVAKQDMEFEDHYLMVGTTGSTSDPSVYIKLDNFESLGD